MASMTHEGPTARRPSVSWLDAVDLWSAVAIVAIWVAVLFTAIFAPDMRFESDPTSMSTIPSVVPVALFALFATGSIAKWGFGRNR